MSCDCVEAVSALVTAGAAVWAAIAGTYGLSSWRAQVRGNAEYDVARRTLRAVLAVRENVGLIRAPFVSAGEIMAAFKTAGLDPATVKIPGDDRADGLVYEARWKPLSDSLILLEAEVLEAEVLWGSHVREAYQALARHVTSLRFAIEDHLREKLSPQLRDDFERAQQRERGRVLFAQRENDTYEKELVRLVVDLENMLRPYLKLSRSSRRVSGVPNSNLQRTSSARR